LKANTKYYVYYRVRLYNTYSSTATTCAFAVYDGTNYIGEVDNYTASSSTRAMTNYAAGEITYSSAQYNKEFTVYAKRSVGDGTCSVMNTIAEAEIGIIPVTEGINNPHILNNVISSSSGGVRVETALLYCHSTSSIFHHVGDWVASIGNVSSGACVVTFNSGIFSARPGCVITPSTNSPTYRVSTSADASTETNIYCRNESNAACSSFYATLTCVGAR
jgi:hypothetical protein